MARINRSSVLLWFQQLLGLQAGSDKIPIELNDKIQATVDIGPKSTTLVKIGTAATTSASVFYTTPADKDFYLTFINLAYTKDVVCNGTGVTVSGVIGGLTIALLTLVSNTVTLYQDHAEVNFSFPVKLDRNTPITLSGAFGAGTMYKAACIGGFILE
jgi:hypothetical protein